MGGACLAALAFFAIAAEPRSVPAASTESNITAAADDIEPIDFALAFETARRCREAGFSSDEAAEVAQRVIEGESPFVPISAPTGSSEPWMSALGWLSDSEAKLLQHQVIRTDGWPAMGDLDSPRVLRLRSSESMSWPQWCEEVAEKLRSALGNRKPDMCDVHACEPGQRTEPLSMPSNGEPAAILSLGASAALLSAQGEASEDPGAYPFPARNTVPLDPRSILLITHEEAAPAVRWGHCVHSGGRHLSLVFRCSRKADRPIL